ncbi:MAG TPA: MarR family transcriptional regulator [bacterium]|nr:MarR family transcriptional regulator [bacterium]
MAIEDEIKQVKFRNEYHKLLINIVYTGHWLNEMTMEMLRPFDITTQQYNVLRILRGQYPKPVTIKLVRERMIDKMSDASRLIERLRLKGYVQREICHDNRRSVDVVITKTGLELLTRLDDKIAGLEEQLHTLPVDKVTEINTFLDRIRE